MKWTYKILLCTLLSICIKSEAQLPYGYPSPYNRSWYRVGWMQGDSGIVNASRDTNFIARFRGTQVYWLNPGVDSAVWYWTGYRWQKMGTGSGGGGGGGAVNQVINADGSLTISPTTGNVVASFNTAHAFTVGAQWTFNNFAPILGTRTQNGGVLWTNGSGLINQSAPGTANGVVHGGTTPTVSAVNLQTDVSNILPPINGGSGIGSYTAYGLLAAGTTSTGNYQQIPVGTSGQILQSGGAGALPNFFTPNASVVNGWLGYTALANITSYIQQGTNVTLSGAGTLASPYVINVSGTGGTVLDVNSNNLSPLFNTSVANISTHPVISYTFINPSAFRIFGNFTNAAAAPNYYGVDATMRFFSNQLGVDTTKGVNSVASYYQLTHSRDTVRVLNVGAGLPLAYTSAAGDTFKIKRPLSSTTNTIVQNSDSSWSVVSALNFQNSLVQSGANVNLVNDATSPGNSYYYGTNGSGTKGFFVYSSLPIATPTVAGLLSAADKKRLDSTVRVVNDRTCSSCDSIAYSSPSLDTLYLKGVEITAGSNVTVTKNSTLNKVSYQISTPTNALIKTTTTPSSNTTVSVTAGDHILNIEIIPSSNLSAFKVGTSSGADDVVPTTSVTSANGATFFVNTTFISGVTLYVQGITASSSLVITKY